MRTCVPSLFISRLMHTAAHAQAVSNLLTKKLLEAPGKVIEVSVNHAPGAGDATHRHDAHAIVYVPKGKLRGKFVKEHFSGSGPDRLLRIAQTSARL
jgi:hypothetical protein